MYHLFLESGPLSAYRISGSSLVLLFNESSKESRLNVDSVAQRRGLLIVLLKEGSVDSEKRGAAAEWTPWSE